MQRLFCALPTGFTKRNKNSIRSAGTPTPFTRIHVNTRFFHTYAQCLLLVEHMKWRGANMNADPPVPV